jgi:hypothetical protein
MLFIAYFEQQGVADKLDRQARASADQARVDTAAQRTADAASKHDGTTSEVIDLLTTGAAGLKDGRSEHTTILRELAADVEATRDRIRPALSSIDVDLHTLRDRVSAVAGNWPTLMTSLDEDLRQIQADLGGSQTRRAALSQCGPAADRIAADRGQPRTPRAGAAGAADSAARAPAPPARPAARSILRCGVGRPLLSIDSSQASSR